MKTQILKSGVSILAERPDFNLVGRDQELSEMINILGRRFAHNILLIGQGGVGCSALCYGLQQAKSNPSTPFDILHKRIWWLDVDGLFSDPDNIQTSFDTLMNTLTASADKDTILIIEDTRDFIEAVNTSGNGSFINKIMRELEAGKFQVIFEVRDTDIEMVLNSHSNMREQFTMMEVKPPSNDKLQEIVSGSCVKLHKHHGITIQPEAIDQAIHLTTTYPGKERSLMRSQPEASLTLIDRALATYKNVNHSSSCELDEVRNQLKDDPNNVLLMDKEHKLVIEWNDKRQVMANSCESQSQGEQHLIKIEAEMAALQADKDPESFLMSSRDEQDLALQISETKKIIKASASKFSEYTDEINSKLSLSSDDVFAEFSKLSGIP
jgi:ATP-dependent Clp protease ATP-binding subunit ClpB